MKIARLPLLLLFFTACHDNDGNNKEAAAIPLQAPLSKSPSKNPVWTPPNTADPIDEARPRPQERQEIATNERLEHPLHTTDSIVLYRQPKNNFLNLLRNNTPSTFTKTGVHHTVYEYSLFSNFSLVPENGNLEIKGTYTSSSIYSAMVVEVTGRDPIFIELPATSQADFSSGVIPVKKHGSIALKIISSYMSTIPEIKDLTITLFKDQ